MATNRETCFQCIAGEEFCTVYTNEPWCVSKINKWMEKYPEQCKNFRKVDGDGGVMIDLPSKCMRTFGFPKKMELSEEEKKIRSERMKRANAARKEKSK